MTKKILIGVGALAIIGGAYYFWKKNKEKANLTADTTKTATGEVKPADKKAETKPADKKK